MRAQVERKLASRAQTLLGFVEEPECALRHGVGARASRFCGGNYAGDQPTRCRGNDAGCCPVAERNRKAGGRSSRYRSA